MRRAIAKSMMVVERLPGTECNMYCLLLRTPLPNRKCWSGEYVRRGIPMKNEWIPSECHQLEAGVRLSEPRTTMEKTRIHQNN